MRGGNDPLSPVSDRLSRHRDVTETETVTSISSLAVALSLANPLSDCVPVSPNTIPLTLPAGRTIPMSVSTRLDSESSSSNRSSYEPLATAVSSTRPKVRFSVNSLNSSTESLVSPL